jgi:hypothetical protein
MNATTPATSHRFLFFMIEVYMNQPRSASQTPTFAAM